MRWFLLTMFNVRKNSAWAEHRHHLRQFEPGQGAGRSIGHNSGFATRPCRRPIKMSLLCQLEMTLPWGFLGGVWGDGSADERWRAYAARVAAGFGSTTADG